MCYVIHIISKQKEKQKNLRIYKEITTYTLSILNNLWKISKQPPPQNILTFDCYSELVAKQCMTTEYDRKRIRWSNTWIKENCKKNCQECLKTFAKYLMNSPKMEKKWNWKMPQIKNCWSNKQKLQRKDEEKKNITMSLWPKNHWWWNQSESSLSTLWNHPKWEENESWKCLRLGIAKEAPKNAKERRISNMSLWPKNC